MNLRLLVGAAITVVLTGVALILYDLEHFRPWLAGLALIVLGLLALGQILAVPRAIQGRLEAIFKGIYDAGVAAGRAERDATVPKQRGEGIDLTHSDA